MHKPRSARFDDARHLRELLQDRSRAGLRGDPVRDDSRGARDSSRKPSAPRQRHSPGYGRCPWPLGRRDARRGDHEFQGSKCLSQRKFQDPEARREVHARRAGQGGLVRYRERSVDVDAPLDVLDAADHERRRADHAVRMSRRKLRVGEYSECGRSRREPNGEVAKEVAVDRRYFLSAFGATAFTATEWFTLPGLFAEQLVPTANTGEGPFYPDKMPLDTDNDLLIINDAITPAVGEITHLTGRVLSITGQPVRNAFVAIWQVESKASYIHSGGANTGGRDGNFQGYGRFLTDSKGQYYFRTIKPISYTLRGQFRAAHIHIAVSKSGKRVFTTQIAVNGHPDNARDFVY